MAALMKRWQGPALVTGVILLAVLAAVGIRLHSAHQQKAQAVSRDNFAAVIGDFLDQRGYLCLAKYDWPITVSADDAAAHSANASQMPALEKLGLVAGKDVTLSHAAPDGHTVALPAREYQLTEEGQKYWRQVPVVVNTATQHVTHAADLCVAHLSLDRVIGWERPLELGGQVASSVLFTYHLDLVPWAKTPAVRQAFPVVARVAEGTGTMQLREGVHLAPNGWVVDEMTSP